MSAADTRPIRDPNGLMQSLQTPRPDFWRGRRVLLTGHTGFKGSWLGLWLAHMGAEVTGFALEPPTEPSLYQLTHSSEVIRGTVPGDVRDGSAVAAAVADAQPEIVFHLAAQSLVRESYRQPVDTYATNVMGTVNVLEAIRQASGVRAAVMVTSDKCYQNNEWLWGYRETDPLGGFDPYSNSKGCAELVVSAYRNSFSAFDSSSGGTSLASVRAGNVIGGGDWATDRLVPDLMRGFIDGNAVQIRGPHAVRPWQHVLEPLSGYLLLAERLCEDGRTYDEAWNFGPPSSDARTVAWIADQLASRWGEGASWVTDDGHHPHEAQYLRLDWSKAHLRLGWAPRWSIGETLDHIVHWFKSYRDDASAARMRRVTLDEIDAYQHSGQSTT